MERKRGLATGQVEGHVESHLPVNHQKARFCVPGRKAGQRQHGTSQTKMDNAFASAPTWLGYTSELASLCTFGCVNSESRVSEEPQLNTTTFVLVAEDFKHTRTAQVAKELSCMSLAWPCTNPETNLCTNTGPDARESFQTYHESSPMFPSFENSPWLRALKTATYAMRFQPICATNHAT